MQRPTTLLVSACLLASGCLGSIDDLAKKTTQGAVEGLTEPQSRKEMQGSGGDSPSKEPSTASPEVSNTPNRAEGAQDSEGSDDSLAAETGAPTPTLAGDLAQHVTRGVLAALRSRQAEQQIVTIAADTTRAVLKESLSTLGDEVSRERLRGLADDLTSTTAESVATALDDPRVQRALESTTRAATEQAVAGVTQGIDDALSSDGAMALRDLLWVSLGIAALMALAFVAMAVLLVARARRARSEVDRLEAATLLLATALREQGYTGTSDGDADARSERRPSAAELAAMVQRALMGRVSQPPPIRESQAPS